MSQLHPDPGTHASVDKLLHERLEQLSWHINIAGQYDQPEALKVKEELKVRYVTLMEAKIKREQAKKKSRVYKKKVQPIIS